jgi:hypothetical protein
MLLLLLLVVTVAKQAVDMPKTALQVVIDRSGAKLSCNYYNLVLYAIATSS